jgi:hypothetical protein
MAGKLSKNSDTETYPDAWQRFERAVDIVAKSPPQHKTKAGKGKQPSRKKGKRKKLGDA